MLFVGSRVNQKELPEAVTVLRIKECTCKVHKCKKRQLHMVLISACAWTAQTCSV